MEKMNTTDHLQNNTITSLEDS